MADEFEPNPDYPTRLYINPADYFRGEFVEHPTFKTAYYSGLAGLGALFGIIYNAANRRPLKSGIPMYVGVIGSFLSVGYYFFERRHKRMMERDAIYIHYIETHPEDFPPIERKQYKDMFRHWVPVR